MHPTRTPRPTRRQALRSLASLAGAGLLAPTALARSSTMNDALAEVVRGHTDFAFDLHRALVALGPADSACASPHSVWSALGMLREGAAGETRAQLDRALGVPEAPEGRRLAATPLRVGVAALRDRLAEARREVTLTTADAVWAADSLDVPPVVREALESTWGAGLERARFAEHPDAERQRINRWVEDHTGGRIEDLLPEGSVTALTRLVLTDAIHFKGLWQTPFAPQKTRPGKFTRLDGTTVRSLMMQLEEPAEFGVARLEDRAAGIAATAVELPYAGEHVSFVALVPDAHDGLPGLEAWLTAARLSGAVAALAPRTIGLVAPRLALEPRYELESPLTSLGIRDAFREGLADFTGFSPVEGRKLWVGRAVHAAFLELDEAGTEAAAATGIVLRARSAPQVVALDRPFVFLIRERRSGALLFLGRVTDPTA